METLLTLIVIALIVYVVIHLSKGKEARKTHTGHEQNAANNSFDSVNQGSSSTWDRADAFGESTAFYTLVDIYRDQKELNRYNDPVFNRFRLQFISAKIMELQDSVKRGIIRYSENYKDVKHQFNAAVGQFKELNDRCINLATTAGNINDQTQCPNCGFDIGKEVTRARNCPSCNKRIFVYRFEENGKKKVLIPKEIHEQIEELEKAMCNLDVPNMITMFAFNTRQIKSLQEEFAEIDKQEKIQQKARDMNIDLDSDTPSSGQASVTNIEVQQFSRERKADPTCAKDPVDLSIYKLIGPLRIILESISIIKNTKNPSTKVMRYKLIEQHLINLNNMTDNPHISKASHWDSFITEYYNGLNQIKDIDDEYQRILNDIKENNTGTACPNCNLDLSSDMPKSLNCPACGKKFSRYRIDKSQYAFISTELRDQIDALANDIISISIPNNFLESIILSPKADEELSKVLSHDRGQRS